MTHIWALRGLGATCAMTTDRSTTDSLIESLSDAGLVRVLLELTLLSQY